MAVLRTSPCISPCIVPADSVVMASKSNAELYFFILVEKKDLVCSEKMSYTDTVVMEALEQVVYCCFDRTHNVACWVRINYFCT